jgi:Domain of unknown function (DUF1905)
MALIFSFEATLWAQVSTGAWHFVSLPKKTSENIRQLCQKDEGEVKSYSKHRGYNVGYSYLV